MKRYLAISALLWTAGCGESAVVTVSLDNVTSSLDSAPKASVPARFGIRLANIYLAENVDSAALNSVGDASIVWSRTFCTNDCAYVDLARSTLQLNSELRTQAALAHPGTYRYVRLELCQGSPSGPTFEWGPSGATSTRSLAFDSCAITSAPIDPPLQLTPGDTVQISLEYDLATATRTVPITESPGGRFLDCVVDEASATKTCVALPAVIAKVSRSR
jgi:hypothetical protein